MTRKKWRTYKVCYQDSEGIRLMLFVCGTSYLNSRLSVFRECSILSLCECEVSYYLSRQTLVLLLYGVTYSCLKYEML